MSESTTIGKLQPIELNDDNYDLWARRTEHLLEYKGIWWVVDYQTRKPTSVDARASTLNIGNSPSLEVYQIKWEDDARKAKSTMLSYTDQTRWEYITNQADNMTPAELWAFLRATYQKRDANTQVLLLDELVKLHLSEASTHDETKTTFDNFQRLAERMRRSRVSVDDIFKVLAFRLCADKFSSIINVVALKEDSTISSTLQACLSASRRQEAAQATIKALITNPRVSKRRDNDKGRRSDRGSGKGKGEGRSGRNNKSNNGSKPKCDHCEKAHESDECWKQYPNKRPEWLVEKQKRRKMSVGEKNSE